MNRSRLVQSVAFALMMLPQPAAADGVCRLCSTDEKAEISAEQTDTPLSIEITTNLDFSRAALTGSSGGQIDVDPRSGSRDVAGLVDLGGYASAGTAIVRGQPGRPVRIDLPPSVRLTSSTGGFIEITDLRTDLGSVAQLDSTGRLSFSFGGRIEVRGSMTGTFRGRIPITANYE